MAAAEKFCQTGNCITKVGLSHFCTHDQDGNEVSTPIFPFKLTFDLTGEVNFKEEKPSSNEEFMSQFQVHYISNLDALNSTSITFISRLLKLGLNCTQYEPTMDRMMWRALCWETALQLTNVFQVTMVTRVFSLNINGLKTMLN